MHTPMFTFTAKEVLMLLHAVNNAVEDGSIYEHGKKGEVEALRRKLSGGGDK